VCDSTLNNVALGEQKASLLFRSVGRLGQAAAVVTIEIKGL